MSQKNKAGHCSNCQMPAEKAVISSDVNSTIDVSTQKRKEEAKQILYLNRV
jgi:hypothetical protein